MTSLSGNEGIGQQHPDESEAGVAGTRDHTNAVHMSRDGSSATQSDHQHTPGHNQEPSLRQTTLLEIGAFVARNRDTDNQRSGAFVAWQGVADQPGRLCPRTMEVVNDTDDLVERFVNSHANDSHVHQVDSMGERTASLVSDTQERQARNFYRHRVAWTLEMLEQLEVASWKRATESIEQRAEGVATASASFGRKSLMWNSYFDSLIPYPSRVALPNESTLK